jgi:quercetin dioxygenase-like cupin family protein
MVTENNADRAPVETVTPVFRHEIPNVDHRAMVAVVVTYPPGGKSPVHRHAPSAFIYAHVLSGAVRSQVDGAPPATFRAGEGFYEDPGSHHTVSENASSTEPASMLAIFIVDPDDEELTIADADADAEKAVRSPRRS